MSSTNDQPRLNFGNILITLSRFLKKPHTTIHKLGENPVTVQKKYFWR